MNRRSFLKKLLGGAVTISALSGGTYYYAREIEPSMLKITHKTIASTKIPVSFQNLKIVQFSDTHIGYHYHLADLEKLVAKINHEQPDIIVFTGDLIDQPNTFHFPQQLSNVLKELQAPLGKFWVYGNHDHGGYGTETVQLIFEHANFQLLKNSHTYIQKDEDHIVIAGIDDVILGQPNVEKAIASANHQLFTILLAHEPDYADIAVQFPVDVQLSGHSHGGQVRFPFIGHLYTPAFAQKYISGKYTLNNGNFSLYVNRGIGTTRMPLRFMCIPEVYVFTLNSTNV